VADSPVFDSICQELEQRTSLSRLEARGTVRLALKAAGLQVADVTREQMAVVLEKVLPAELGARRIDDPKETCAALAERLAGLHFEPGLDDSPEAVFARLAGS
jgi:hypothetical protein